MRQPPPVGKSGVWYLNWQIPLLRGRLKNIEHSRPDLGHVDFGINWSLVPFSICPRCPGDDTIEITFYCRE